MFQSKQPATRVQDPAGFEQCSVWVRDRAQTQGEDDGVEGGILDVEACRIDAIEMLLPASR
jgi:hypothetical protein